MIFKANLYVVSLLLIGVSFLKANGQDTLLIRKAPIVIKRKVFYTNQKEAYKNYFALEVFSHHRSKELAVNTDNWSIDFSSTGLSYGMRYGYTFGKVSVGSGVGSFQLNYDLNGSKSSLSHDSTKTWQMDTLDYYFKVRGNDTIQVFVTDSSEVWNVSIRTVENDLKNKASLNYITVPLFFAYTVTMDRWQLTFRTTLLTRFLIGEKRRVFELTNGESIELDFNKRPFQFSEVVEVGFKVTNNITVWTAYTAEFQRPIIQNTPKTLYFSGAFGTGVIFFF